ncbi:MAG: hypothetical protein JWO38_2302 [Gemmataceae bacterium]|nr:hypothetical protein [Gemmataceae bacterium]
MPQLSETVLDLSILRTHCQARVVVSWGADQMHEMPGTICPEVVVETSRHGAKAVGGIRGWV